MAIKTYSVLKDMRHPLYLNRMLKAGQSLDLDAGTANLYQRLGVIGKEPKGAVPAMTTQNTGTSKPKKRTTKKAK